jgi:hypothetical protein
VELRMITFFLFFVVLFSLFETVDSYAEKIHAVRINKAQVIVDGDKRNELTAYLVSENGSGGVIVTSVESPKFGVIKSICAKEKRELLDIGHHAGKKSGIELRVIFEDEIVNLPPEAWITFNIYQSSATEICTHSVGSIFC